MNSLFPKTISLTSALLISFVGLTLVAVGLPCIFSFVSSRDAVRDVAHTLRDEFAQHVEKHVLNFLHQPVLINKINAMALSRGTLSNDPDRLTTRFAEQIELFPNVSSIYFGNTQGGVANSGRNPGDDSRYVIVTEDFAAGTFRKFSLDASGHATREVAVVPGFDARTRPWYRRAVSAKGPIWSEIYVLFTGQDMALAASRPAYDTHGNLLGVVGVDVFLSQISAFLRKQPVSPNGHAFIFDRSGLLVAGSTRKPLFLANRDGTYRRLHGRESDDPAIRRAMQALSQEVESLDRIQTTQQLTFYHDGQIRYLQVFPLQTETELDWLLAVIVPEADFMGGVMESARHSLIALLGALLLAGVISITLARKIANPICALEKAAGELAKGRSPEAIHGFTRIAEVRNLYRWACFSCCR